MCVCTYIYTYACACVCVRARVYTSIYIYTHTHTHTHLEFCINTALSLEILLSSRGVAVSHSYSCGNRNQPALIFRDNLQLRSSRELLSRFQ